MGTEIYQKILNEIPHKNKYLTTEYDILDYILILKKENERLNNMLENDRAKNLELIVLINEISDIVKDENITGIEAKLKILEILGGDENDN